MGTSLTNENIQDTYLGLIKTNGCNQTLPSARTVLTDGNGNNSSIAIGTQSDSSGIHVCGCGIFTCDINVNVGGVVKVDNICNAGGDSKISLGTNPILINDDVSFTSNTLRDGNSNSRITFSPLSNLINLVGNVNVTGNLSATQDLVAFTSSDKRLKNNLNPIDSDLFINNLTGYSFEWNEKSDNSGKGYGIIAQDLQKIAPELVNERNDNYLSVNYISLIPVLIEEIKNLKEKVKNLELQNK